MQGVVVSHEAASWSAPQSRDDIFGSTSDELTMIVFGWPEQVNSMMPATDGAGQSRLFMS